ncbi:ABC transporter permease [Roseibium denhamense]|uniref:Amino acid/amide ABC transporter substrate-binding protein, HAAT family n=1 Tax=Roseibium denhamense TaxID=76305 RepID=A0ABY1NKF9_9HYPH|nr:ABC transporter substrate-binding protein [Roseibium denhamense]MTI06855.1 ABC transporter permease [Roseibium denhamense]SMP12057.1 amino acid/amide ABC transporter substrate-binding protein, HAAT family [Roseibium denhamense]
MGFNWKVAGCAGVLSLGVALSSSIASAAEIYIPNLSYRTGPFAATGIPLMNGQRDYVEMLNARDGGVGGAKLIFDECETGYNTNKGVECYEKTKSKAVVTQPWSTGITLQVLPRTNVDKIPILAPGYGFSPMADGEVFAWAFNPPISYWDGASMILNYISDGDLSSLNGKKVALLHLDHPFGKEPIPLIEKLAEENGFEFLPIPVGLKEMQNQSAQWLQIRRERPDFVIMWGWGAMNAGAITEAVKTRYPMDQFVGVWWSGYDGDLKLVGEKGKGYKSISWNVPGSYPVMDDIKTHVVDAGNSLLDSPEDMNSVFYQRGIVISMILVEGIKAAQEKFGTPEINAEQLRWGLENLNITDEVLADLGMAGMTVPFSTSCTNHTGHGGGWMLEWNGTEFVQVSDKLMPDRAVIEPLEKAKAAEYAESNAPWPDRSALPCE